MNNSFFKEEVECWGRKFEIDVSLTCYEGEKVLDSQSLLSFRNKFSMTILFGLPI